MNEASGDANSQPTMSVESLRRSNDPHDPTRTLRLTEQEHSSRENTPLRITMESLASRPRSNPRTRTPLRYESPLDPSEFRRESLGSDNNNNNTPEARRITIRPLAGSAVGTVVTTRIHEERPRTPKSRKQGPSHRKIRRWNNDHFEGLAAEISSSSRGTAEALLKAQEEAHLHRPIWDPKEHTSETLGRFLTDDELKGVRDRFFEGELPAAGSRASHRVVRTRGPLTAQDMMNRIENRLRKVVIKACTNSYPAAKVVEVFEDFVVRAFAGEKVMNSSTDWWNDLLLEQPTVTTRKDSATVVAQFYFDAESSTGGFHRLLLHAVAQFHGLKAVSKMVGINIGDRSRARALSVSGSISGETEYRLLDHIVKDKESRHSIDETHERLGSWTLV